MQVYSTPTAQKVAPPAYLPIKCLYPERGTRMSDNLKDAARILGDFQTGAEVLDLLHNTHGFDLAQALALIVEFAPQRPAITARDYSGPAAAAAIKDRWDNTRYTTVDAPGEPIIPGDSTAPIGIPGGPGCDGVPGDVMFQHDTQGCKGSLGISDKGYGDYQPTATDTPETQEGAVPHV